MRILRGVALLLAAQAGACAGPAAPQVIVLATTTSVVNSGLLDALLPAFERERGIALRVHQAGSGRALAMMAAGQADIAISHAPAAERRALDEHPDWRYRKIMFNDFVLAGPPADPAAVAGAPTIDEAMRRLAGSGATFVSRGDESGTHERERDLWARAGVRPDAARVVATGQGMANTLRVASTQAAYVLTDRPTFLVLKPRVALEILFEHDAALLNTYAVIVATGDRPAPVLAGAQAMADWLVTGEGRRLIERFTVAGAPAFRPLPPGSPASRPSDVPLSAAAPPTP